MKKSILKRILNLILLLALAVTVGSGAGNTLSKYVFFKQVGTFSLNIVPYAHNAEDIAVVLDTTGMQYLSAELIELGSTFAESGEQSYGILLTSDDGFLLPETFTITISETSYTITTVPDAENPDGFSWLPEDNLLVISGDLLLTGGTIFITAEAVPEAETTMELDLSQMSNVTVSADGTPVTGSLPLTGGTLALTLQANDGYVLPDSFTVAIGEITYTVTTADGTVTDDTNPVTDITYADSVLTIAPTLLSENMSISMNITGVEVATDTECEETPTEGTDALTEGEETPTEGNDTPTEGEETPTEGSDTPAVGEDTTDSSDKTTETKETPSENGDAPAGSEVTSSEGGEVPSEGDDAPTDGEDPAAA